MALYATRDLHNWEVLGEKYDVHPDPKWYQCRMDELHVMDAVSPDTGYFGYITSEPHHNQPASFGMLRSEDCLRWKMVAPPEIVWGSIPQQIPEVGFCERIGDKYYLTLGMRCYLGELGYSMFTFTSDAPVGPFVPDKEAFRLCGTTTRDSFYLTFSVHYKDQLLASNWFTNGFNMHEHRMLPLKKVHRDEGGHLRLVYWDGNEAIKGKPVAVSLADVGMEHPAGEYAKDRYSLETGRDWITMQAGRDSMLVLLPGKYDLDTGLVVEGAVTASELSLPMITHLHPAVAGFYIEETPGQGTALLLETLGVTRIGSFAYSDHPITDTHEYSQAATNLIRARGGETLGTSKFESEDVTRTIGYATAAGIRKKTKCRFRLLVRDGIFECYLDDLLVQTLRLRQERHGKNWLPRPRRQCEVRRTPLLENELLTMETCSIMMKSAKAMVFVVGAVVLMPSIGRAQDGGFARVDGTHLTLGGKPFRAIGVNIPHLAQAYMGTWHHWKPFYGTREAMRQAVVEALIDAQQHEVAFVRFFASPGYPKGTAELYLKDKEEYWRQMDELFEICRKHRLKLVPSLGVLSKWHQDFGEPRTAVFDPKSKTHAANYGYIRESGYDVA